MTSLMELPLETFRQVMAEAVCVRGLKRAMRLRTVSKMFASEILEALFTLHMSGRPLVLDDASYSVDHSDTGNGESESTTKQKVKRSQPSLHHIGPHGPLWIPYLLRRVLIERPNDGAGLMTVRVFAKILAMEDDDQDINSASKAYLASMCELVGKTGYAPFPTFWQNDTSGRVLADNHIVCPSRDELDALDFFQGAKGYFTAENLLAAAAYSNNLPLATRLVGKGYNVFENSSDGFPSPYQAAIYGNHPEMLDLLFRGSSHERSKKYFRRLALIKSAHLGHGDMVELILQAKWVPWDFEQGCRRGTDAYAWKLALNTPDVKTLNILMSFPESEPYRKTGSLRTLRYKHLDEAVKHNWLAMARHLLESGITANGLPKTKKTKAVEPQMLPLYQACFKGNTEMVKLLCDHGARPRELHLVAAASKGHLGVTRILVDLGIEARGIVARAASSGCVEVVKLLIDRGAEINNSYPGLHMKTFLPVYPALIGAIVLEHTAMFRLLIERGAELTPQIACEAGANAAGLESMLDLLKEYGVDINLDEDF
ncbi:ankyrin [Amniculicola lignicola CBS 123094]|uniref:Ankyrin n=1 Tax=Amniculicola lignicola CBS 123094 TaxID=1392246 RepID=A0A6A5WHU1_9PLEO|nr:ankyrin [Amniculicola lignicola CBS 123094]